MAALMPLGKQQYFAASGAPLVGGKVYTYAAGTTTPLATYTDAGGLTPNANPVVLDSRGEASIFFSAASYKIVLKDSADVTIWTQDNLAGDAAASALAALAASGGSALVGFIQSGTGAAATTVQAKLRESVSVKDFGAKGDGVTDDTTAIQAAIDNAKATNAKELIFPSGSYKVTSTLNIKGNFGYGFNVRGMRSTITSTFNGPVFLIDAANPTPAPQYRIQLYFTGFTVVGSGVANTSSTCITLSQAANVLLSECYLTNSYIGLSGVSAQLCKFRDLVIYGNATGVYMTNGLALGNPNALVFNTCHIYGNTKAFYAGPFPNGVISLYDCEIEGNNLSGNTTDGVRICEFNTSGIVNMTGCHFEGNLGQYGIYFDTAGDATKTINMVGCEVVDLVGTSVEIVNGYASVIGGRIASGVTNTFHLLNTTSYAYLSGCETSVSGNTGNAIWAGRAAFTTGKINTAIPTYAGAFYANQPTSNYGYVGQGDTHYMAFLNSAGTRNTYFQSTNNGIFSFTQVQNQGWEFDVNNAQHMYIGRSGAQTVEPGTNNTKTLGSAVFRWSEVFAVNGTINTSDAREKQQVKKLSDSERAVAERCKKLLRSFKFNDAVAEKGDAARIHFGVIAQDVKAAFESEGLNAENYAMLCYDEWEDQFKDKKDAEGRLTGEKELIAAAGNRYGVRYEELLAFIIAAL